MVKNILICWFIISLSGMFQLNWMEDWFRLNIKIKHIVVGVVFLPVTLLLLIFTSIILLIERLMNSKFGKKLANIMDKDILK